MTEELKFCVDCKHYWHSRFSGNPEKCTARPERDLVSGWRLTWDPKCARSEHGECGTEGKLWEKRQKVEPEVPAPPPPEPESPEIDYKQAMHSMLGMQGTIRIAPEPDDKPWWKFW